MSAWHKLLLLQLDFEFSVMRYHFKIVQFLNYFGGEGNVHTYLLKVF